jgi:hypothetical protein
MQRKKTARNTYGIKENKEQRKILDKGASYG